MAKADTGKPREKAKPKPKLTDAERHKRFVDMAHEVQADESQNHLIERLTACSNHIESKGSST